ncbi:MAG TPA: YgiT-type zinc finger protein [Chloroflexota bacterium]|nr:YgiT-type zinc finger protein [Chloroflexota bacterium]
MANQGSAGLWHTLTEEVVSGMAEWRVGHPRATLREIEQAVDERLAGVRARLVEDAVLRSTQADLTRLPAAERPVCPACGAVLEARGKQTRRVTTRHDREIRLERSYAVCPQCGDGLFPPG